MCSTKVQPWYLALALLGMFSLFDSSRVRSLADDGATATVAKTESATTADSNAAPAADSVTEPTTASATDSATPDKANDKANDKVEESAKKTEEPAATTPAPTSPVATVGVASARLLSNAFREAAEKTLPTVVTVLGQVENKEQPMLNIIGGSESQKYASMGSGVIVSPEGLILTNHHVIADARRVDIRLYDGHVYEAEEIKSDPASDLAILRIRSDEPFPAAALGNSDELHVGDWVLAIGSPFQLEASVSAGIISRTERFQRLSQDVQGRFLQTDAAINPGNSGGPLLDLDGNVIGINTAITSRNGAFQGVGFAIPITRAKWIRKELVEHGKVRRGQLGVRAYQLPPDVADELKLAKGMGVQVESVVYNRAGQKAGLKPRDVILRIGSEQVTAANFSEVVQQSPIGEPLKMSIIRDGEPMELSVVMEAKQ